MDAEKHRKRGVLALAPPLKRAALFQPAASFGCKAESDGANPEAMRIAAADVGGTKTVVALYEGALSERGKGALTEVRRRRYLSADFEGFSPLLSTFLEGDAKGIDAVGVGVAGPVFADTCRATNLPWELDARQIEAALRLPKVALINDFAAVAWGVGELASDQLEVLQDRPADQKGVRAIIGAGTGLGEAIVVPQPGGPPLILPSEGGHADFAPRDELEIELLRFLIARHRRVSYERVLSGRGLVALYDFMVESGHAQTAEAVERRFANEDPAAVVSSAGLDGSDEACARALSLFCSLYGSEAGNLALKTLPNGGVYVAGGIAPKVLPALRSGQFLESFCNKGRMRPILEGLRISAVLDTASVSLLGAQRLALSKLPG